MQATANARDISQYNKHVHTAILAQPTIFSEGRDRLTKGPLLLVNFVSLLGLFNRFDEVFAFDAKPHGNRSSYEH